MPCKAALKPRRPRLSPDSESSSDAQLRRRAPSSRLSGEGPIYLPGAPRRDHTTPGAKSGRGGNEMGAPPNSAHFAEGQPNARRPVGRKFGDAIFGRGWAPFDADASTAAQVQPGRNKVGLPRREATNSGGTEIRVDLDPSPKKPPPELLAPRLKSRQRRGRAKPPSRNGSGPKRDPAPSGGAAAGA